MAKSSIQEQRLKGLYEKWKEIQEARQDRENILKQYKLYKKKVRVFGQELPKLQKIIDKLLDEYNKMM